MPMDFADNSQRRRGDSTTAERMVLALEEIAEHLKVLALSHQSAPAPANAAEADCAPLDNWENEGGTAGSAVPMPKGIVRLQNDVFVVGPYRYTSMVDAVAQLKRSEPDLRG